MKETYIGTRHVRPDSVGKVTGAIQYTADLFVNRRDILVAKVLRVPCSHAKILRVDVEKARCAPGVAAVMTAQDLPGRPLYGNFAHDRPVIAWDEVICDGDPVALVAAETEAQAQAALDLMEVEYEPLPVLEDPRLTRPEGAPLIHPDHPVSKGTNVSADVRVVRGDADAALATAEVIVENRYQTPIVEHAYIEPDVSIAEPNPLDGGITIHSPQHGVHLMRKALCVALNLPISKIHVVSLVVGGGFGGKECSSVDCSAVAGVLALKTGRPVMYQMTREEVFRYTSKRHRSFIHYRLGADREGNFLGLRAETLFDKGAYKSVDIVPHRSAVYGAGAYRMPAADIHNLSVFTHHTYGGAFRGLGAPQQYFALESAVDDLARTLGMDPIQLRLKNILRDGDYTIFGQRMRASSGMGLEDCLVQLRERMDWDKPLDNTHPVVKRGRGVACYMYGTSTSFANDGAHAYMEINADGSINVNISQNELGQGLVSAMTLITAEAMGVTPDLVRIGFSDSLSSPECGATVASRTTVLQGNAIVNGCGILKKRFLQAGSVLLSEPASELDIRDNQVFSRNDPEKRLPLREVLAKASTMQLPFAVLGSWYPPPAFPDPTGLNQTSRWTTFAFGAHGIEVEVDTETGVLTVTRSIQAIDLGRAINPATVEGQLDGGTAQALGMGLMEEAFLRDGRITNNSYHEFLIPTAADLPRLESILVESGNAMGPYGAKGIGEPTLISGAAALRNAVLDATGLALYELPLTPVRIMAALEDQANAREEERLPFFRVPLEEERKRERVSSQA